MEKSVVFPSISKILQIILIFPYSIRRGPAEDGIHMYPKGSGNYRGKMRFRPLNFWNFTEYFNFPL